MPIGTFRSRKVSQKLAPSKPTARPEESLLGVGAAKLPRSVGLAAAVRRVGRRRGRAAGLVIGYYALQEARAIYYDHD